MVHKVLILKWALRVRADRGSYASTVTLNSFGFGLGLPVGGGVEAGASVWLCACFCGDDSLGSVPDAQWMLRSVGW